MQSCLDFQLQVNPTSAKPPEARKKNGKILPLSPQEIVNPDMLISYIWPTDMQENKSLLFYTTKFIVIHYLVYLWL